jgi:hypothetical protein
MLGGALQLGGMLQFEKMAVGIKHFKTFEIDDNRNDVYFLPILNNQLV